jgi:hypothetical protein
VAFDEPFDLDGKACHVGLTVGYALAPDDGREAPVLLRAADAAMYAGKQAGKGRARRAGQPIAAEPPVPDRPATAPLPAGAAAPRPAPAPLARAER